MKNKTDKEKMEDGPGWHQILGGVVFICILIMILLYGTKGRFGGGEIAETEYLQSADYFSGSSDTDFVLGYTSESSFLTEKKDYYTAYRVLEDGALEPVKYNAAKTVISDSLKENEMSYAEIFKNSMFGNILKITLYVPKGTVIYGRE